MQGPVRSVALKDMQAAVGSEIGVSDWISIDQKAVDAFADLTGDHYFIHTDPERARRETPFGGTIVHGFFTMSMLAQMAYQAVPAIKETKTGLNYGFDRLRFIAPVPTGSRVRGRFRLANLEVKSDRWQTTMEVTVEIEGRDKPALAAQWIGAGLL